MKYSKQTDLMMRNMENDILHTQPLGDVWSLESEIEETASKIIRNKYDNALLGRTRARNILKSCFESDWQTIKERFETEGSVWYVWYMDGVRKFIREYLTPKGGRK